MDEWLHLELQNLALEPNLYTLKLNFQLDSFLFYLLHQFYSLICILIFGNKNVCAIRKNKSLPFGLGPICCMLITSHNLNFAFLLKDAEFYFFVKIINQ